MPGSADEAGLRRRVRSLLVSVGSGITGSAGDAEDVVQDALPGPDPGGNHDCLTAGLPGDRGDAAGISALGSGVLRHHEHR